MLMLLVGCETTIEQKDKTEKVNGTSVKEFTYDGCEYVYFPYGYGTVSHKGNCKNPIHQYNKSSMVWYDWEKRVGETRIDSVVINWKIKKIGVWINGNLIENDSITKIFSTAY